MCVMFVALEFEFKIKLGVDITFEMLILCKCIFHGTTY